MKPATDQLIAIYSRSLARYEAQGDAMAGPTRAMIDALKQKQEGST